MNNLTEKQRNAKEAYLNNQTEQMIALYEKADTSERKAIIGYVDSFLSGCNQEEKSFWLKFRQKLERLNEKAILFPLGNIYLTVAAKEALEESGQNAFEFLSRHQTGDFGIIGKEDWQENEFSIENGFRILSAYKTKNDVKIWLISEADRSSTTCLLPSEY
ncbi:MAG TPA: hypothetical protein VGC97_15975 [Pyrinomonadaceae bacterium]|jgi:hypothetical protein